MDYSGADMLMHEMRDRVAAKDAEIASLRALHDVTLASCEVLKTQEASLRAQLVEARQKIADAHDALCLEPNECDLVTACKYAMESVVAAHAELEASRKDAAFQCERAASKDCVIENLRAELAETRALMKDLAKGRLEMSADTAVRHMAEIASLRAELAASNKERGLLRVEAEGHDHEIEERGAELDRLRAAARQDAEEKARLTAEVEQRQLALECKDQEIAHIKTSAAEFEASAAEFEQWAQETYDALHKQTTEEIARLREALGQIQLHTQISGLPRRKVDQIYEMCRTALACRPQEKDND